MFSYMWLKIKTQCLPNIDEVLSLIPTSTREAERGRLGGGGWGRNHMISYREYGYTNIPFSFSLSFFLSPSFFWACLFNSLVWQLLTFLF